MPILDFLIAHRHMRLARLALLPLNLSIPAKVQIGKNFKLVHYGMGTVILPEVTIGDNVRIYHQVTIGRKDAHVPRDEIPFKRIDIEDNVVIFPGAKILGGPGVMTIADGTLVGANSVLTKSTKQNEIWAGAPAKLVGHRDDL